MPAIVDCERSTPLTWARPAACRMLAEHVDGERVVERVGAEPLDARHLAAGSRTT